MSHVPSSPPVAGPAGEKGCGSRGGGRREQVREPLRAPKPPTPPQLPFEEHLLCAPQCIPFIHAGPESSQPRPVPQSSHSDRDTVSWES